MLRFLFISIALISYVHAMEFGELVRQYVKINEAKINIVKNHRHRIKGVEIIVADKSTNLASRFGHGMLRLIDDNATWTDDVVVSFSALPDEKNYSIRKSITGGYPILPQVMTMLELWSSYSEDEGRDLIRYVINLNDHELGKFLDTLFEHLENPGLLGKYTFLSNNCIGALTRIFVKAGVTKNKSRAYVPTSISSWILKNDLTLYPEFVMKTRSGIKEKAKKLKINDLSNDDLLREFTKGELHYIYFNDSGLSEEKVDFLAKYFKDEAQGLNEVYDFSPVHQDLYSKCASDSCFRDFAELEMKSLKPDDLVNTIVYRLEGKEKELKDHLQYLSFKQETLVVIKKRDHRYLSHRYVTKKNETFIEFRLSDIFNEQVTQRYKLPETRSGESAMAVVKTKSGIELRFISL